MDAQRELSLLEWVERLPACHAARKELNVLQAERDSLAERLRVAMEALQRVVADGHETDTDGHHYSWCAGCVADKALAALAPPSAAKCLSCDGPMECSGKELYGRPVMHCRNTKCHAFLPAQSSAPAKCPNPMDPERSMTDA